MKKKKYADEYTTTRIGSEEYDIIYSAGYAECLRDMINSLNSMVATVNEEELDLEEYLEKLIIKAEETLDEESNTIN